MTAAKMTSKGQITIPAQVRGQLSLKTGDKVEFVELPGGGFKIMAANLPITAIKGMVARPARPVTVEQMNEAVRAEAAKRNRRK